jgi:uncharacterized membrane protein
MNAYLFFGAVIATIMGLAIFFIGKKIVPNEWKENETAEVAIFVIGAMMFSAGIAIIIWRDAIPI